MTQIEAIYEQGVFRPLEHVSLPEHQRVQLNVEVESRATDQAEAEIARRQMDAIRALQKELEGLPVGNPNDGLGGRDHDLVLYGKKA